MLNINTVATWNFLILFVCLSLSSAFPLPQSPKLGSVLLTSAIFSDLNLIWILICSPFVWIVSVVDSSFASRKYLDRCFCWFDKVSHWAVSCCILYNVFRNWKFGLETKFACFSLTFNDLDGKIAGAGFPLPPIVEETKMAASPGHLWWVSVFAIHTASLAASTTSSRMSSPRTLQISAEMITGQPENVDFLWPIGVSPETNCCATDIPLWSLFPFSDWTQLQMTDEWSLSFKNDGQAMLKISVLQTLFDFVGSLWPKCTTTGSRLISCYTSRYYLLKGSHDPNLVTSAHKPFRSLRPKYWWGFLLD